MKKRHSSSERRRLLPVNLSRLGARRNYLIARRFGFTTAFLGSVNVNTPFS